MASVLYQNGMVGTFENTIDWETDNLDARLLMNTTTADTEHDVVTVLGLTLLDECDATGYATEDVTNPAVTADDTDNEMVWDSDDWVWSGLSGDGTRDYQGALLVKWVDGGAGDIPLLFVDFDADIPSAATQVTAPAAAEGFLNVGQPA